MKTLLELAAFTLAPYLALRFLVDVARSIAHAIREDQEPEEGLDVDPETLDLMLEEVRRSIDAQKGRWDQLDARVRFVMGVATLSLTIILGLALGRSTPLVVLGPEAIGFAAIAGIELFWALILLMLAYLPKEGGRALDPVPFVEKYKETPANEVKMVLLRSLGRAYDANESQLGLNNLRCRIAFELVGGATLAVAASLGCAATGWCG